jgi:prevent-host-death family protein
MKSVGCFEAKTHLTQLLRQVAKGEKILITRRGRPAALLIPPTAEVGPDVRRVVEEMLAFQDREGPTLGGAATTRELIEEGRRF